MLYRSATPPWVYFAFIKTRSLCVFLLVAELRALLIKPSVPGGRGKECQLSDSLSLGLFSQIRGGQPTSVASYIAVSHGSLDFPSAICQKAGSPARISPPLSLSRSSYPVAFFSIPIPPTSSSAPRNASLPRFKRTRRARLLCQRPNRKSQLLRASLSPRALCLFLRFP